MKILTIGIIILSVVVILLIGNVAVYDSGDDTENIIEKTNPVIYDTSSSDCVNTPRIACVPKGGGYNLENGDVTNEFGKVVSTKAERELNVQNN